MINRLRPWMLSYVEDLFLDAHGPNAAGLAQGCIERHFTKIGLSLLLFAVVEAAVLITAALGLVYLLDTGQPAIAFIVLLTLLYVATGSLWDALRARMLTHMMAKSKS